MSPEKMPAFNEEWERRYIFFLALQYHILELVGREEMHDHLPNFCPPQMLTNLAVVSRPEYVPRAGF